MKDLRELLGAKKKIDPIEKDAKLSAIKNMRKMAGDMMADDMQNMKKVTVAAPDDASLKKGLDKAKEVLGHSPESLDEHEVEEGPEDEALESPQEEMDEVVESLESPEEIDKLIAKLNEKKLELAKG